MKKTIIIVLGIISIVILFSLFYSIVIPNIMSNIGNVKRRNAYTSWEGLVSASEHVVIGKVGKVVDTVKIDGLRFVLTEIEVLDNIKNVMPVDKFQLLQTDVKEDPIVKRNDTVLLFLYKFEGPQTDYKFTYACRGMFDGQFLIINNIVKRSYVEQGSFDNAPKELSGQEIWGVNSFIEDVLSVVRASSRS